MFTEVLCEATEFETQFSQCRGLLQFMATRIVGDTERSEEAVENCFRMASRNPPSFEYEGELRSWLVRILVDEALQIRRRKDRHSEEEWTAEYWRVSMQEGDPL